jgi:hypothetical protein
MDEPDPRAADPAYRNVLVPLDLVVPLRPRRSP